MRPRYIIIKEHDESWGVIDTIGLDQDREMACVVIASRMTYQAACSMAYLFEHEWTVGVE